MALGKPLYITTLAVLSACIPNLQPPNDTLISCDTLRDCPANWTCVNTFCLSPENSDAAIPRVTVAFTLPANGAEEVSVTPNIVIAFNFDIETASLDGRVVLNGGPLVAQTTPLSNTFSFTPEKLEPNTAYELRVLAGVEPLEGYSRPSEEDVLIAFRTGDAPDTTPPAPVSALLVDRIAADHALLEWTRPSDADFAGVLILRKTGGVVTAVPEKGKTYAIGASVGDAEVIASVQHDRWDDVTVESEANDYAVFAFDADSNYSAPTRAPFVTNFTMKWCPDETGFASAMGPDQGVYQLRVSAGTVQRGVFPAQPTELGEQAPLIPNDVLALGELHTVRLVATGATGVSVSSARELWLSKRDLTPLSVQPTPAALGAPATLSFSRFGWPAFAFEADTQPLAGTTTYAPLADALGRFQPAVAGVYRMRVKPVVSDCPDTAWTESAEFNVGNARFVGPNGGSGDHTGSSPANAAPLIESAVLGDTFVAEGDYDQQIEVRPGQRILGGYSADFSERDPQTHVTRVFKTLVSDTSAIVAFNDPPIGPQATGVIDGFVLDASQTSADIEHSVVRLAAPAVVSNNTLIAGGLTGAVISESARGIYVSGIGTVIRHNTIRALSDRGCGILAESGNDTLIEDNDIIANVGISITNSGIVRNNRVAYRVDAEVIQPRTMISVESGDVLVEGNLLIGHEPVLDVTNGLVVHGTADTIARYNRISGGGGVVGSRGVHYNATGTLFLHGNLIDAGRSPDGSRSGVHSQPTGASGRVIATNNTISFGVGANVGAQSGAFYMSDQGALIALNNLIFADGDFVVFRENPDDSIDGRFADPRSLDNNVVISPATLSLYADNDTSATPAPQSIAGMQALLWCQESPAENNQLVSAQPADVFVDYDGPDGDVATLLDNDWHLLATAPADVRTGGIGPMGPQPGCGAVTGPTGGPAYSPPLSGCSLPARGSEPCNLVPFDFDLTPRTTPWSVGAFERD